MTRPLAPGDLIIPPSAAFAMRKAGFNFTYAGAQNTRFRDFRAYGEARTEADMLPYFDRVRIITRLRQLVRDDPYCAALVSAYATQLGTSTLSSLAGVEGGAETIDENSPSSRFNDAHERAWLDFAARVEYCGLSLPEVESILWREDLIAGELFFLKLKSGKLQMIPSEFCASDYSTVIQDPDSNEHDGVRVENGIVTGYRFGFRDKTGSIQPGKSITPAENVIHFFFQDRPEQRRGVPRLAPVLNVLQDIFEICGAKVNQVKTQSFISGVVTKNYAPAEAADLLRLQNSDGTRSDYQDLRGGTLYYLETGEDMKPFQSSINANDFDDFLKSRFEAVGGAVGMPAECWIEGFRDSNYSSARATVSTWIRTAHARRAHEVSRFLEPLHEFWVDKTPALFSSAKYDPSEIVFTFPGVPAIDENKQNESDAKALAACLTTYAQVYGAKGQFWDTQFKQIQREKQRMAALGIAPNYAPNSTAPQKNEKPAAHEDSDMNHREAMVQFAELRAKLSPPAPVVNVSPAAVTVNPQAITINPPEVNVAAPVVNMSAPVVNVEAQPAPVVNVAAPIVKFTTPPAGKRMFIKDADGKTIGIEG